MISSDMDDILSLSPTQSTKRAIKKRTILLYQGEVPRQAYIVHKGTVKVYRLGRNGDEQIIGFRVPGDIFPETWLFGNIGNTSSALYYYEAMDDCEIITAERAVVLKHIDDNPDAQKRMLDYFTGSYSSQLLQLTALEQSRAADKLLLMLYFLMVRYTKETSPGNFELRFHLTHTTMGNLTGLTRETTSVELGKLRRKGVVTYTGNQFTIHREELQRLLAKESFSDVQLD